ncbi:MAG: hypothetical protein WC830_10150 [Burkholderiales bacterium]|jgi:hypothetical protein
MNADPRRDDPAGLEEQKTGAALLAEAYADQAARLVESDEALRQRLDVELGLLKAILSGETFEGQRQVVPMPSVESGETRSLLEYLCTQHAKLHELSELASSGPLEFLRRQELRAHYDELLAELIAERAILKARASAGGWPS